MNPKGPTREQVADWFRFHPATPETGPVHDRIRAEFGWLADALCEILPAGSHRTLALRKLQEAMWAANSAVAIGEQEP